MRRLNGNNLDAVGVDSKIVMKWYRIKVAVYRAEIGKIGSATSEGIQTFPGGRTVRYTRERNNECSKNSNLRDVRHILILEK